MAPAEAAELGLDTVDMSTDDRPVTLSVEHARLIVARDHGFAAWSSIDVPEMLRTSAHPNAAGVSAAIEHALATS